MLTLTVVCDLIIGQLVYHFGVSVALGHGPNLGSNKTSVHVRPLLLAVHVRPSLLAVHVRPSLLAVHVRPSLLAVHVRPSLLAVRQRVITSHTQQYAFYLLLLMDFCFVFVFVLLVQCQCFCPKKFSLFLF